jgi:hypothetical protein
MRRAFLLAVIALGCGSDDANGTKGASPSGPAGPTDPSPTVPPQASCAAAGGGATVAAPTLTRKLTDEGGEGWLASPAVADLDGDGKPEIIAVRSAKVYAWRSDGTRAWTFDTAKDRIWASPVVGNFTGDAKLEVAVAGRDSLFLVDAAGAIQQGFPQAFGSEETRTLAAGDVDGDGALDLVVGNPASGSGWKDIVKAYRANGSAVTGFPPVASGVDGCPPNLCFAAGLYDQNLAIGDLDGDGKQDLILPQDNAYASFFKGTGVVFDSNPIFTTRPKTPGVRYLHDYAQAKQGYPNDNNQNQAHFTNTPPAIADIDKDGTYEIVMVASVQNAGQTDRKRGVALWVLGPDASRRPGWEAPLHVPAYVMGLGDGFNPELEGSAVAGASNLVGLTNQVTVAEIDPDSAGLEMVFAGFDGKIHAASANKKELWTTDYATNGRALTGGVVVADLSADGVPEIVFTTYSPDQGGGNLFVLSSKGAVLHKIALPTRGSMAVPTIADADGNGTLDIVVSLKDWGKEGVYVYEVPGSKPNCLLWPTGRGNFLRNGWVR